MRERFIVRKENFGGIVYDRETFSTYTVDDFGFEVINRIGKQGVSDTLSFFQHTEDYEDIKEYLSVLELNHLIKNSKVNGRIIHNRLTKNSLSAPIKAYLTITDFCNIRCEHCFGDFGIGNQMSLEQVMLILDELEALGVTEISLTGGEPFCHPYIYDIIELIADRGFVLQTCTNGTIMNDDLINLLKKYGNNFFRLSVSIDGIKEVHDQIRGEGTYDKVIENIKKLQKNDVNFGFNTVLTTLNLSTFNELLDTLNNLGLKQGSFSPLLPTGRAKDNKLSLMNNTSSEWRQEIKDALARFSEMTGNNQYIYGHSVKPDGSLSHSNDQLLNELDLNRCGAGSLIVTIRANGDLLPCVFLSDVYERRNMRSESMFEKNFKDIWDYNEQFKLIRSLDVDSRCQKCDSYKNGCYGGCPAISDLIYGDLLTPDPYCPYYENL